jgi:hypothetical protein
LESPVVPTSVNPSVIEFLPSSSTWRSLRAVDDNSQSSLLRMIHQKISELTSFETRKISSNRDSDEEEKAKPNGKEEEEEIESRLISVLEFHLLKWMNSSSYHLVKSFHKEELLCSHSQGKLFFLKEFVKCQKVFPNASTSIPSTLPSMLPANSSFSSTSLATMAWREDSDEFRHLTSLEEELTRHQKGLQEYKEKIILSNESMKLLYIYLISQSNEKLRKRYQRYYYQSFLKSVMKASLLQKKMEKELEIDESKCVLS